MSTLCSSFHLTAKTQRFGANCDRLKNRQELVRLNFSGGASSFLVWVEGLKGIFLSHKWGQLLYHKGGVVICNPVRRLRVDTHEHRVLRLSPDCWRGVVSRFPVVRLFILLDV